MTFEDLIS